ncbi:hypothetical protein Gotur_010788 [Gossypium turneri]
MVVIHLKDENPKTFVDNCYTKETQLAIYSNFIRPIRGPKQWEPLPDMLPILPPPIRRPPGRPTKIKRKELDEPQTTVKQSKKGSSVSDPLMTPYGSSFTQYQ